MVGNPEEYIIRLKKKDVRPTAIRLLVIDAITSARQAVSLSDLEVILDTVDKSSIFRTLELFVKHHIVHSIDDGTGSVKYEICEGEDECTLDDMHIHFYCTVCHKTFCFTRQSQAISESINYRSFPFPGAQQGRPLPMESARAGALPHGLPFPYQGKMQPGCGSITIFLQAAR